MCQPRKSTLPLLFLCSMDDITLTCLIWIVNRLCARVRSTLLVQGGHWLGKKRRHSPRPRVGSAESSSDFGMCSPNVNLRQASTSAQLIYDQLVVVCVTKRSIVNTPRMRFGLGPLGVVRAKVLWQSDRIHSQTGARRNADQAQTKGARLAGGWS